MAINYTRDIVNVDKKPNSIQQKIKVLPDNQERTPHLSL